MTKASHVRKIIFSLMFIGVALPLIFHFGFPVEVTENSQKVYDMIESLPEGSKVLLSFDYDPSSKPELSPMALGILKHCFEKKYKPVLMALWPMGTQMGKETLDEILPQFEGLEYGIDYANIGFKSGGMVTLQAIGKDLKKVFPTDTNGTPIDRLEIMNNVKNYNSFGFVVSFSAGAPGIKEWVLVAHDKYGCKVSGGTTAVQAPQMMAYVNEQNQLMGLLGGLKGAAEYESLINTTGSATRGMDAQSIAHLIIIIFIAVGNIKFYLARKANRS